MSYLSGNYYSLTDIGCVRKTNEDSAAATINSYGNVLLVVADGMGGANKGEYASSYTVKKIVEAFQNLEEEFTKPKKVTKWLYSVISDINEKLLAKANKNNEFQGMGTTLSLALIIKDTLYTAQIGDSRIYMLMKNKLTQISVDQSYATYLLHKKSINVEEAIVNKNRHVLTNALGTKKRINVDLNVFKYNKEKILLCSDGLYNNVAHSIMETIVRGSDSLDKKAKQLITFGNANGGSDNMAIAIWESK